MKEEKAKRDKSAAPISLDELESYLWQAAVDLRGQIDATAYKDYIFPLVFFKRICDVRDEEYANYEKLGGKDYAGLVFVSTASGAFKTIYGIIATENLVEDTVSRKELLELIRQHYLHTGSALAGLMLDDFSKYIDDFIQVVPIEYKRVLEEEKMLRLHKKIADIQRDY